MAVYLREPVIGAQATNRAVMTGMHLPRAIMATANTAPISVPEADKCIEFRLSELQPLTFGAHCQLLAPCLRPTGFLLPLPTLSQCALKVATNGL